MNFQPDAQVTGKHVHSYCNANDYSIWLAIKNIQIRGTVYDMSEQLHLCGDFCPNILNFLL